MVTARRGRWAGWTLIAIQTLTFGSASLQAQNDPRFVLVLQTPILEDRASTGGVTWIDFDGDGDDDIFVTNGYDVSASTAIPQGNRLYENVGGRFVRMRNRLSEDAGFSSGCAWADFDNDGRIDVFVPNQRNQRNFLYRNLGDGRFELLSEASPSPDEGLSFSATWGDIDADGLIDLFVSNGGLSGRQANFLYRNRGNGHFSRVTVGPVVEDEFQSGGATFVDYDLDGDIDIYVPGEKIRMYRNDGTGEFDVDETVAFAVDGQTDMSLTGAWADFDNDGDFDLIQTFLGAARRLYVNEGQGRFRRMDLETPTHDGSYALQLVWADLNNDGFDDLVVANWGAPPQVYMSRGAGRMERKMLGELGTRDWFASCVAAADYDGDGDIDLLAANWPNSPGAGEENLLYRNEGPVGHWLGVRLEGSRSNRSAIGARVSAEIGSGSTKRTLTREVRSQDGWRCQSSLTVHFGLGSDTRVEKITVRWPSGEVQTAGPFSADQRIDLKEPGG